MKPTMSTTINTALAAIFSLTAIGLFWYADVIHADSQMAEPPAPVERQYVGNADLYRYMITEDGPTPPKFKTRVLDMDHESLQAHIENAAARRHWLETEARYPSIGYIMPDYDIDVVRRISTDPYGWAQEPEQQNRQYTPKPDPNDMMKVELLIRTYQPSNHFLLGAILSSAIAAVLTITAACLYTNDATRPKRK